MRITLARASLAASASAAIALCNITGSRASLLVRRIWIKSSFEEKDSKRVFSETFAVVMEIHFILQDLHLLERITVDIEIFIFGRT